MLKRVLVLLLSLVMLLVLCSCDSEQVKNAKEAYAEGEYAEVVKSLSEEENLDQSAQDLLIVSEANVAFENEDYLGAVQKLVTSSKGLNEEQYEEMFTAALEDAVSKGSTENILALLEIDASKEDAVFEAITTACKEKNYNGFLTLDGLVAGLEDGDLKTKLADFDKEYETLRAEAFMVGNWEWTRTGDDKACKLSVVTYGDGLIGRLTELGTFMVQYHYNVDDVYWKDFQFDSKDSFLCYNLTRYNDAAGTAIGEIASGKIDYENKSITLTVAGATDPVRTWKRID